MTFEDTPWTHTVTHWDENPKSCLHQFNDCTGGGGAPVQMDSLGVFHSLGPGRVSELVDFHNVDPEEVKYYIQQRCRALGVNYDLDEIDLDEWTEHVWLKDTKVESVFPEMKNMQ